MAKKNKKKNRFLLYITVLFVLLVLFLKFNLFILDKKISEHNIKLNKEIEELKQSKNMTWYVKLNSLNILEDSFINISWYKKISKLINMFDEIKNVDTNDDDIISLSDFNITLDKITLKWKVSKLRLLYYDREDKNFESLLTKFEKLSFLENISIKNYENVNWEWFEFILTANVKWDDK